MGRERDRDQQRQREREHPPERSVPVNMEEKCEVSARTQNSRQARHEGFVGNCKKSFQAV